MNEEKEEITPLSEFKTTELHRAVKDGELERVKKLVGDGADIEALSDFGDTAVMDAVGYGHVEVARWLLGQGARMSYEYKREETVAEREMLDRDYKKFDVDSREAMEEIFSDLPEDLREEILSEDNQSEMRSDMIDLHFDVTKKNVIEQCHGLAMLKMLVGEYGADIDYVDPSGYWPLLSFAESGDLEAVRWLLESGADPEATSTGMTAVFKAVQSGDFEMVKLFLEHGASLDVVDVDGCGVFLWCESVKMAELLMASGADPTVRDQADFPSWYFIDDEVTKAYVEGEAGKWESR
ncbi:MAG: ankyrin repeat domain-containing protein [Akkermansiaceae bacterium]